MNKVHLIGNLTRDPELTETSSGVSVCRFSIAVNRNYAGADGERKTDFFNCIAWRGTGETISRYCNKGNKVAVSGSIEQRTYDDRNGDKKTVYEVLVQDVEFLTPKRSDDYGDETGHDVPKGQRQQPSDYIAPPRQQSMYDNKPQLQPLDDSNIPF